MVESEEPEEPAVRQLATRVVYENAWMRVREDEIELMDGTRGIYGVVEKPDYAVIIPIDHDGSLWLVEQYRYPIGCRRWEFPQGSLEDRPHAPPSDVAAAELREETGLVAGRLEQLGHLHQAYGYSTQRACVFLARDLASSAQSLSPSEQDLLVRRFTVSEFEQMVRTGDITDVTTVAAWALLQINRRGRDSTPPTSAHT
jgi:8-oxo-dGTP pyrophosphatase MutT (NUDIX family)